VDRIDQMKTFISRTLTAGPIRLVLISLLFCPAALSQGSDPKPQDATKAILAAFDKYQVVGMGAAHGFKDQDDYILSLISNPAFSDKVNDIVAECGNRLYQGVLDRYIAGEDMPPNSVQQVWGNTTQQMCSLSGFYPQLFALVRQINQSRPANKRLRVLAADPPIDWNKVLTQAEYISIRNDRNSSITSVIMTEVLVKKHKALLLFGKDHLTHKDVGSSVANYEKTYPGITLTIFTHRGFGSNNPLDVHNDKLETRMKAWPIPSLVPIKGTWLADLDLSYYSDFITRSMAGVDIAEVADAYLYLGPRDTLSREKIPAEILDDKSYIEELNKRPWPFGQVDAEAIRKRRITITNHRFYEPTPESRTPDSQMPLAKFVGTYTGDPDGIAIIIDIHQGKLIAKMPMQQNGTGLLPVSDNRFRLEGLRGEGYLDFEIANGKVDGLTFEQTAGKPKIKLRWNP
jgi:hypothetical protein